MADSKQELASLILQITPYAEALVKLKDDIIFLAGLDEAMKIATTQLATTKSIDADLRTALEQARAELVGVTAQRENVSAEIKAMYAEQKDKAIAQIEIDTAELKESYSKELEVLTSRIEVAQASVAELDKEVEEKQAELAAVNEKLDSIRHLLT